MWLIMIEGCDFVYKDTLKNRVRFGTTLDKEVYERLREYASQTMIPVSKLMDIAITNLLKEGVKKEIG